MIVIVLVFRLDRIESNSNYYRGCDVGDHGRISSAGSKWCLYRCCDCNRAIVQLCNRASCNRAVTMAMAMAIVVLILIMIECLPYKKYILYFINIISTIELHLYEKQKFVML